MTPQSDDAESRVPVMPGGPGKALKRIFHQDDILGGVLPQEAEFSLLMNPVRREIFIRLCDAPCQHTRAAARTAGIGQTTARWHLERLTEAGYVETALVGNRKVFWPTGMIMPFDVELIAALRMPYAMPMLQMLSARTVGATEADIVRALGEKQQLVEFWLRKLGSAGVVERQGSGRGSGYLVSGELAARAGEYDGRAAEFSRELVALLRRDGLMPSKRRLRGSRLTVQVRLPGGVRERLHLECSPTAGIRRYLGRSGK